MFNHFSSFSLLFSVCMCSFSH